MYSYISRQSNVNFKVSPLKIIMNTRYHPRGYRGIQGDPGGTGGSKGYGGIQGVWGDPVGPGDPGVWGDPDPHFFISHNFDGKKYRVHTFNCHAEN